MWREARIHPPGVSSQCSLFLGWDDTTRCGARQYAAAEQRGATPATLAMEQGEHPRGVGTYVGKYGASTSKYVFGTVFTVCGVWPLLGLASRNLLVNRNTGFVSASSQLQYTVLHILLSASDLFFRGSSPVLSNILDTVLYCSCEPCE